MNENELRQALAGHAASVTPAVNIDRLSAGMERADRLRSIKMTGLACLATALVTFGAVSFTQGEDAAPLDVVDQPKPTLPDDSEVALPVVDDADSETDSPVPTTSLVTTDGTPDHLATTEAEPPITTAAVVTAAPSTTAAPPTTNVPPTTTTTASSVGFTANARYESCAEDPSYDEYSGTANPGATITVTSPYNSPAQVTADESGDWFIRVEFPTAPLNEAFSVTVGDGMSSSVFGMIHTG
jgi:hypothetical protein